MRSRVPDQTTSENGSSEWSWWLFTLSFSTVCLWCNRSEYILKSSVNIIQQPSRRTQWMLEDQSGRWFVQVTVKAEEALLLCGDPNALNLIITKNRIAAHGMHATRMKNPFDMFCYVSLNSLRFWFTARAFSWVCLAGSKHRDWKLINTGAELPQSHMQETWRTKLEGSPNTWEHDMTGQ